MTRQLLVLAQGLLATCLATAAFAQPAVCPPARYFAPDDPQLLRPLSGPHADFARALERASAGNAAQQRSVAVAYEAGYLVNPCPEKALHWYRKAAAAGDDAAKQWLARQEFFEKFRSGAECAGGYCPVYTEGPQLVELYAGPNGGYVTQVRINDVSVDGIVDTGATFVSMSGATARKMNIAYENGRAVAMMTANGSKAARMVSLPSVRVGNIVLYDVPAAVSEGEMPLLLGMSFLGRLNVNINSGRMSIARPEPGAPVTIVENRPAPDAAR